MSRSATAVSSVRLLRIFVLALAALWTAAVGASLLWGAAAIRRNTSEQLELQTRLARAAGPGSSQGEPGAREALEAAVVRYNRLIAAGHVAVWLTGLGFLTVGGRWLLRAEGERDNAERRLMREHQTLRLLYDHSPDAVAVIDRGRRLLYANRVAESAAGVAPAALHGRICHEAMHADASPCQECLAEEVFRDGRPAGCVRCERAAEGEERWLWQQWYPVHGVAGDVESVVEIARDVSDLKRTEAELARHAAGLERANRLKELFTDVLSHDLLNPAAASRYFVEQLREGETDPRRLRHYDALAHNLDRLVEMIQNASLYSRLDGSRQSPLQVLDLGEAVRGVLADLQPQLTAAGMSVAGPAEDSYPARVHPMFTHVIANLVGNAVKYAAAGKKIAVEIVGTESQWVLSVQDWGAGIDAEGKVSLFTRFERLGKQGVQGTGLGLAIARRIVDLQGGSIWIEDNPEGGSIFRVRVSKAAADEASCVSPLASEGPCRGNGQAGSSR